MSVRSNTRLIGRWLVVLVAAAVAAPLLVRDFQVGGSVAQRLLAGVTMAAVLAAGFFLLYALTSRALRPLRARSARELNDDDFDDFDDSAWRFFAPFRRLWLAGAVQLAVLVAGMLAALWLAVSLCQAFGLPVRLPGFWPIVLVVLVIIAIGQAGTVLLKLLRMVTRRGRTRAAGLDVAQFAGDLAGLAIALALLDNVRLASGPGELQLLTLVVFAQLLGIVTLDLNLGVPGLTTLARIAINGLKLWLLTWLSTWMTLPLSVSGFWTFVLAALIITITSVPARLARTPPQPHVDPDPFADHHHQPPLLY